MEWKKGEPRRRIDNQRGLYYSLFFPYVSRAIVGVFAWESSRMSLYAVRVKYLHDATKVDALDEIVDVRVPNVVTKDQKRLLDSFGLGQRDYQMSEVGESRVHLNHYDRSVASQRAERLFVVHSFLRIRSFYVPANFRYFQFAQSFRASVR